MAKAALKSKTLWVNALTTAGSLLATYGGLLTPAALPYVIAAQGAINVVLRFMTTQPIEIKPGSGQLR